MGRTALRWIIGVLGVVMIVAGSAIAGGAWWVQQQLGPDESLRSAPQSIVATGCRTLLVEVADAGLATGEVPSTEPVGIDAESQLAVLARGTATSLLVGLASATDVVDRLLGARYCLATSSGDSWTATPVQVRPEDSDVSLGGLQGRWAQAGADESVILPIPTAGQTLVVAAEGAGELGTVELVGVYRLGGANDLATMSLIGGIVTGGVGTVLLIISIVGLRRRGRHESGAQPRDQVSSAS